MHQKGRIRLASEGGRRCHVREEERTDRLRVPVPSLRPVPPVENAPQKRMNRMSAVPPFHDERDNVRKSVLGLENALIFLDLCRKDPTSGPTRAKKDAIEWVESEARKVVEAAKGGRK